MAGDEIREIGEAVVPAGQLSFESDRGYEEGCSTCGASVMRNCGVRAEKSAGKKCCSHFALRQAHTPLHADDGLTKGPRKQAEVQIGRPRYTHRDRRNKRLLFNMAKSPFPKILSHWNYHSGLRTDHPQAVEMRDQVAALPHQILSAQLAGSFKIEFATTICAPNHLVTLRTEVDGWERDLYGAFIEAAWTFILDRQRYPNGIVFKFVLDGCHWAKGMNMSLAAPQDVRFSDQEVQFETIEPRYRHYYDNLQIGENDSHQMSIHANHDPGIVYDLIVAGSGMAGGVLALKAAQLGLKVLVLDAGRLENSTHTFNLPNKEWGAQIVLHGVRNYDRADNQTFISYYPTMNFGGRSVYWYGVTPRMKNWELAHWPTTIANDLEPGGYAAAESLVRKHVTTGPFQENLIGQLQALFPNNVVCDTPRSLHQPDLGQGSFIEQSTGTFSSAEMLFDALSEGGPLGRERLFVNLHHLVTRLEWSGRNITGVVCQDLLGNCERTYRASNFVLATGSIESPRIALRSGLTNPNGRTGVGITDHGSFFLRNAYVVPPQSPFAGNDKHARIFVYADGNAQHRFNAEIELNPDYFRIRHANTAYWQDYLSHKNETRVGLKFTCATPLVDSNYVHLANNPDDKVQISMHPTPFGEETRAAVVDMGTKILTLFGVQNFDLNDKDQMYFGNGGTPHHAGGTMRVSGNGTGVVNTDLRHESYDNLYVCDASVFPFIPAANPSLTLVALALRLAAHL